jgi:hypothetical protein
MSSSHLARSFSKELVTKRCCRGYGDLIRGDLREAVEERALVGIPLDDIALAVDGTAAPHIDDWPLRDEVVALRELLDTVVATIHHVNMPAIRGDVRGASEVDVTDRCGTRSLLYLRR